MFKRRFVDSGLSRTLDSPALVPTTGSVIMENIDAELLRAERHGKEFASMHEAYGVIREEVEEFWDICRMKRKDRDAAKIREELIQIAAMAIKAIKSMPNFVGGDN